MVRLNLGGGTNREGMTSSEWVHIDKNPQAHPTLAYDLDNGIPTEDDTVDEIMCRGVIMYLKDRISFLNECFRVLKDGGILRLSMPLVDLNLTAAFCDIGFKNYWSSETLDRVLSGNAYYSGLRAKFERVEEPTNDDRMRYEVWRTVK
tara:strand:- start:3101 stop:3544 length:444 start_codon:yes stop_codon:yes gene_type:complete